MKGKTDLERLERAELAEILGRSQIELITQGPLDKMILAPNRSKKAKGAFVKAIAKN